MSNLNRVTLIGRLGKDPEVRRLDNGTVVAKFTLATSESYKDKDGNKHETTEWHTLTAWRSLAEIAEKYLKKGMLIYVEGKLTYREYTDKDNVKKFYTEIVCSDFRMLERRDGEYTTTSTNAPQNAPNELTAQNTGEESQIDDSLPF